ncbi:general secretion pathway protein GspL [Variovorax sp. Root411]|uniref:general secretion pathway protein GspL n=1 Tax=Variovorax sp. Root411 TaxID=1736530 RepID=UPI001F455A62|nr:general secretion pathway protein GspL [Variovorax sp. Root411]
MIGLLIAMVLLMKWLMDHQIEAADQRRAQEAAGRTAAARCFAQASHRATDACLKGLEMKSGPTD